MCSGYTTGSSGPTIASTFWKKTIQGAMRCDQSTCFDSSSCSRKLPAVWKNFRGTIGARSRTSASGNVAPVGRAIWSRSKYSRMLGTSSSTTSSSSISPTLPSSNVTSLISALPEPCDDLLRVAIRREHRIEDLDDATSLGDECEPLVQHLAARLERREAERGAEPALRVRDHRERHVVALGELDLVVERLDREPRRPCAELC